jgi:predicted amidohydrolase YtcJ/lysophospholipase L1-like esterase
MHTMRFTLTAAAAMLLTAGVHAAAPDLILYNAHVWTVDDKQPEAEAVAVLGDRIVKVGGSKEILALKGAATRVMDLQGKLLLPGFNDAHTHFGNAAEWFFQAPLTDVNDEALMVARVKALTARVPKGLWLTGGDWAAAASNAAAKSGKAGFEPLAPSLKAIDAVSPDHPLLFRRYDHVYFANTKALQMSRLSAKTPNPPGGSYGKDPVTGELNGLLYGTAGEGLERQLPPMSLKQKMIGGLAVQRDLNKVGITSITDIARIDEVTDDKLYQVHVERSATDLRIFQGLRKNGELTLRVNAMVPIETLEELGRHDIKPGGGDEFIRYGGLKAYGDSGIMFKPLSGNGLPGEWSYRFPTEAIFAQEILAGDKAGWDVGVHIIGDKASHTLINWYADAIAQNPPRERRHRMLHWWHTTEADIQLVGKMGFTADVQPYHLGREVALIGTTLDEERARTSHAWKSMIDAGINLTMGSDLPGSYNRLHVSPYNPLENMYYAVTRMDKKGYPAGGWHPEQRLTVAQAIKAYTLNPAWAAHEEKIKGSISAGKLADMVVLSKDILLLPPSEMLNTEVVRTIMGGKVLELDAAAARSVTAQPPAKDPAKFQRLHDEVRERLMRSRDADLVFIGDSITAHLSDDDRFSTLPGLRERRPLNLGVPGDQTENVLWRLERLPLDLLHPRQVVLLIGTNNLRTGDGARDITAGIEAILKQVRGAWPKAQIVVMGILPRGDGMAFAADRIGAVNASLKALAADGALTFIDPAEAFRCNGGNGCGYYQQDLLHLQPAGYQRYWSLLRPVVASAR